MALGTITKVQRNARPIDHVAGNKYRVVRDVQCSSGANYTAGGETITAAAIGLKSIDYVNLLNLPTTAAGAHRSASIINTLGAGGQASVKLAVAGATAGTDAGAGADLSTFVCRLEFIGPRRA
jgi:hypothetical protein